MKEQTPEVIYDNLYNLYFNALYKWFKKRGSGLNPLVSVNYTLEYSPRQKIKIIICRHGFRGFSRIFNN